LSPPLSAQPNDTRTVRRTERLRHLRKSLEDAQWWLLAALALAAAVLGYWGFADYQRATGGPSGAWDVAYRSLQLFTVESGALDDSEAIPATLQVARFLAPVVAAAAVVRAVLSLFRDQAQLLRLRVTSDHVVICGVGRKGLALARSLRREGYRVVAIDRDEENDLVESCRSAGVPVMIGDATDIEILRRAGVKRAAFVVALCGESGTNAQIIAVVHRLAEQRRRSLTCLAHVPEQDLCRLLRTRFPASDERAAFRLEFFDIYERGAQVLIQRFPPFGESEAETDVPPHMLVLGLGRLGQSAVVQAARYWKFGNHTSRHRFRVTVVDPQITDQLAALRARHPELDTVCRFEPLHTYAGAAAPVTVAYVCFGDEAQALQTGLSLYEDLHDQGTAVVVRGRTQEGLPALLGTTTGGFQGLHGFGLLDQTCDADLLFAGFTETLAKMLHARYVHARAKQGWTYGRRRDPERRTNPALAPWPELAEKYKDSNRDQAAHTWTKLAAVRCELAELTDWDAGRFSFTDEEVEQLAALEHERWMSHEERTTGWVSRLLRRRHPDLVGWDSLTTEEQDVDREFVRALPGLLAQLGFQIVRKPN
jgi:voltage-gated potassium channel Kch